MTSHRTCTHASTSSARAACRKAGGPKPSPSQAAVNVWERNAHARGVQNEEADREDQLRAMAARHGLPRPTPEERAASLTKVWCTTCHLLHDADDSCSGMARRAPRDVPDVHPTDLAIESWERDELSERKNVAAHYASHTLPTFANARELAADIPPGRYAVRHADGDVKFYRIDKPQQGRWAGYVFLKIQSSDDEFSVKSAARQMAVYSAILDAGVKESSALYGVSIGSCGVCGRTLTDAQSIASGIGPVCASKMGW